MTGVFRNGAPRVIELVAVVLAGRARAAQACGSATLDDPSCDQRRDQNAVWGASRGSFRVQHDLVASRPLTVRRAV